MSSSTRQTADQSRARGQVQVQALLCMSCGLCAEYCPQELMKPATEAPAEELSIPVINPFGHIVYVIHDPEGRCTGCGICANACPEGAVVVYRRKGRPKDSLDAEPRPERLGSLRSDAPCQVGAVGKELADG